MGRGYTHQVARIRLIACVGLAVAACSFDTTGSVGLDGSDRDAAPMAVQAVALYELDEGAGSNVRDSSGIEPVVDLFIADESTVVWVDGALEVTARAIIKSTDPATKIANASVASGESSVEVWATPANTSQVGPARVISLGLDETAHNFMIGAQGAEYRARFHTTETDGDGSPELIANNVVTTGLTHLVLTQASTGHRRLYVDGVLVVEDDDLAGTTTSWDNTAVLAFANEVNNAGTRFWQGRLHRVAIFAAAFSGQDVFERFLAGPD
jgi:hypothetical protein